MKKIAGVEPSNHLGTSALGQGWVRAAKGQQAKMIAKLPIMPGNEAIISPIAEIPENDMTKFKDYLNLYVQAYISAIAHTSKLDVWAVMGSKCSLSQTDKKMIGDMGWQIPHFGLLTSAAIMNDDLATFLLLETDFTPAPYKIDERYGSLGFNLLEKATQEADKASNPNKIRDASRQMERHGDILLEHGKSADAIAKWQEILDKYPTYEEFNKIEEKIKKAFE